MAKLSRVIASADIGKSEIERCNLMHPLGHLVRAADRFKFLRVGMYIRPRDHQFQHDGGDPASRF